MKLVGVVCLVAALPACFGSCATNIAGIKGAAKTCQNNGLNNVNVRANQPIIDAICAAAGAGTAASEVVKTVKTLSTNEATWLINVAKNGPSNKAACGGWTTSEVKVVRANARDRVARSNLPSLPPLPPHPVLGRRGWLPRRWKGELVSR